MASFTARQQLLRNGRTKTISHGLRRYQDEATVPRSWSMHKSFWQRATKLQAIRVSSRTVEQLESNFGRLRCMKRGPCARTVARLARRAHRHAMARSSSSTLPMAARSSLARSTWMANKCGKPKSPITRSIKATELRHAFIAILYWSLQTPRAVVRSLLCNATQVSWCGSANVHRIRITRHPSCCRSVAKIN